MKHSEWLVERVRVRAGLASCRQAEAIIDDIVVALFRALPADVTASVRRAIADSPNVSLSKVPAVWRGWTSSLDL